MNRRFIAISIIILFISGSMMPALSAVRLSANIKTKSSNTSDNSVVGVVNDGDEETEYWAVIVGLLEYEEASELLVFYNSAHHMYDTLCNSSGWKEENIQLLIDEDATCDAILGRDETTGFGWLRKKVAESEGDDVILFYFSGHGSQVKDEDGDEKDGKDEIIAPYDVRKEGGHFTGTLVNYISDDMIDEELDTIACKGMCLIFDSCCCGGLVGGKNDVDTGSNRVVMMASTGEEGLSLIFGHGDCFAYRVSTALNDTATDLNNDGKISAEEAYDCGRKAWLSNPLIYSVFAIYLLYLQCLLTAPWTLLYLYFIMGSIPKPYPIPSIYDGYEGELIIIPE